ncbi:TPA: class A sortase [Staphylococcus aureus]|uniref:class A sortase n=1 Tax=Staphylococcus aureus TaxID=1280 RepID=UPI0009135915|nr:class A sortase [Staphylococcus aureus]QPV65666.1 class A sortase [Staphylococcus aureus]SGR31605.1 sortase [Staphylococcus aureus]SGT77867.1 sortase [Staphylococcus aureus]SGU09695.1 sortase [Staphylococcus aureus]HBC8029317.1 class A sortase [Staphylococcus aureus]
MGARNRRKLNTLVNKILLHSYIVLVALSLILGLLLFFHKAIISQFIAPYRMEQTYSDLNKNGLKIKPNAYLNNIKYLDSDKSKLDPNINYNFKAVKPINLLDIKDAKLDNRYIRGQISIPAVNLDLPILHGVSNNNLWFGASTMKPNQKLGEGNYALAGHTTDNPKLLFTPLHHVQNGDSIYITDSIDVYVYRIDNIQIVRPNKSEVIQDDVNNNLLTLVTCSDVKGTNRLIVQAKFIKKEKLTKNNMSLFNI